jgi:putative DNA primase/helicase
VTRGWEWPCAEGIAPTGTVVMLTAEDDIADTVVPRLAAAGADLERIHLLGMVGARGRDRMFSLVTDLPALRQKIAEIGDVALIQIDPVSAYLGVGKVDSFRTSDVRAVLAPLIDLANDCKTAIIGVMHFNKKTDVTNALLRISDSLAFGAAARHVYGVVNDADNKRKLVVRAKNNLASAETDKALAFRFGLRQVGADSQTGKEIWAPYVLWESQHVDITAIEAMQAAADNRSLSARDEAKKFLADMLANGPVLRTEIEDAAEGNGVAWRTVERVKAELGIIARKSGFGGSGGWTWQLPDQPKPPPWTD